MKDKGSYNFMKLSDHPVRSLFFLLECVRASFPVNKEDDEIKDYWLKLITDAIKQKEK